LFSFSPLLALGWQGGCLLDDGHEMLNFFFARIQGIITQKENPLLLDRMYSCRFLIDFFSSSSPALL
jgi:hypothetical protein